MTSWRQIEAAAPDLAARAEVIFRATTNAVLGTVRADGSPRLSGIDPTFLDGELWLGSMPGARKGADLHRDPRLALHSIPYDSRPHDDGQPRAGSADAKLGGRAIAVTDRASFDRFGAHSLETTGWEPPQPYDLFRIDVDDLVVIGPEGEELVIHRWTPSAGLHVVRRTHESP